MVSKQASEYVHYLIHQEQKKCIRNLFFDIDMKPFELYQAYKIKYGITQDKNSKKMNL
jgi:hypothetical protein